MPWPMSIICGSRIESVVVHARGALVTRQVEIPDALPDGLPGGEVVLLVPGLSLLAQPGSLRASLQGARQITTAQLGLHVPAAEALAGPDLEKLGQLERRLA